LYYPDFNLKESGGFFELLIYDKGSSLLEVGAKAGNYGMFLASKIPFIVSIILAA